MTWKQLTERDCREWKLSAIDPHDRHTWKSGVRSAMRAASQLPGRGPLMRMLIKNRMMMMMMMVYLTIKVPVTTTADDILKYFSILFLRVFFFQQMIHIKCQALFSLKNIMKKYFKMSSAAIVIGTLRDF